MAEWAAEGSSEAAAVASLDFAAFMGVAGPRDGVSRPILLDTAGARPVRRAGNGSQAARSRGSSSDTAQQLASMLDLLPDCPDG